MSLTNDFVNHISKLKGFESCSEHLNESSVQSINYNYATSASNYLEVCANDDSQFINFFGQHTIIIIIVLRLVYFILESCNEKLFKK